MPKPPIMPSRKSAPAATAGAPAPSAAQGHPFDALTPDLIQDALRHAGHEGDGRLTPLNSYENRVFQVGVEGGPPLVVKFYRPHRWNAAALQEEHDFAAELASQEVPVAAPLPGPDGATLLQHAGFRYAIFPRLAGRWPDLENAESLETLGRFLGRIHAVGRTRHFQHRPQVDVNSLGHGPRQWLLQQRAVPSALAEQYSRLSAELLARISAGFAAVAHPRLLRLHGDCHPGNILWGGQGPAFVDLDDCRSGPAVQDLWMLLAGSRGEREAQLGALLTGYQTFCDFDAAELALIEPLRALRMLHYAAWLAQRQDDPAFPRAFPWFGGMKYWEDHLQQLREQLDALDSPPISL
jgi:Ser/Thr protein kinase RdoA (MazF antagonist)